MNLHRTPCLEKISDVKKQRENLPEAPAGEQVDFYAHSEPLKKDNKVPFFN